MERPNSRTGSSLRNDLKRLGTLAYHRLESSEDLVGRFHHFRKTGHGDFDHFQKLHDWLFVPITLWPIDIEGLFRTALDRAAAGRPLNKTMILLIDLLPLPPSNRTQRAVSEHEHLVQQSEHATSTIRSNLSSRAIQSFRHSGTLLKPTSM